MTGADRQARAREIALQLIRGEQVGAGDGDTFVPRTPSIDALADALLAFSTSEPELRRALVTAEAAMQAAAISLQQTWGDDEGDEPVLLDALATVRTALATPPQAGEAPTIPVGMKAWEDDTLVERCATAMWLCDEHTDSRRGWSDVPEYGQDLWRDRARACLSAAETSASIAYTPASQSPDPLEDGARDGLVEALRWYGEQARLARLIHSEGDAGRHALAADGGKRARAALSALPEKE